MKRFIRLWQASRTLKHVARALKRTQEEVLATSVVLRLEGVLLKPLDVNPRLFSSWWNAAETVEDLRAMLGFTPDRIQRHHFAAVDRGYLLRFLPEEASAAFVVYQDAIALEAMGDPGRN